MVLSQYISKYTNSFSIKIVASVIKCCTFAAELGCVRTRSNTYTLTYTLPRQPARMAKSPHVQKMSNIINK